MKILILGLFLITSFSLQAQQFVSSDEALTRVADMENSDLDEIILISDDTSELYKNKKHFLTAYHILTELLNSRTATANGGIAMEVGTAVKLAVIKVAERRSIIISEDDYDTDNISDTNIQQLKSHLLTLLTD